ncbi:MAG: hypothetical protein V7704_21790 [Aurantimonas endophytica]|uniref:hypothetical protein n=1 Tax=Aurantimonas endophytica TaxID=1522175 RepID=UPI003001E6E5
MKTANKLNDLQPMLNFLHSPRPGRAATFAGMSRLEPSMQKNVRKIYAFANPPLDGPTATDITRRLFVAPHELDTFNLAELIRIEV